MESINKSRAEATAAANSEETKLDLPSADSTQGTESIDDVIKRVESERDPLIDLERRSKNDADNSKSVKANSLSDEPSKSPDDINAASKDIADKNISEIEDEKPVADGKSEKKEPGNSAQKKTPESKDGKPEQQEKKEEAEKLPTPEEVVDHVLSDTEFIKEYIEANFGFLSETEKAEIEKKYTQPETKQNVLDKMKATLHDFAGKTSWEKATTLAGTTGIGFAVSMSKMALKLGLVGGSFGGSLLASGVVGGLKAAIHEGVREWTKVDAKELEEKVKKAYSEGDLLEVAKIVGNAENLYKSGKFADKNKEAAYKFILENKVHLDFAVNKEKFKDHKPKDKILKILSATTEARKELNRSQSKEVNQLLKEVKIKTEINGYSEAFAGKVAKAFGKGVVTGLVGGTLGYGIHYVGSGMVNYFYGGGSSTPSVENGKGSAVVSKIENVNGPKVSESTNGIFQVEKASFTQQSAEKSIADTVKAVEATRAELLHKDFTAIANKGDGELKMYRKVIHDFLVNEKRLGAGGPKAYSKEQLIYAEEYLNKHYKLSLADGKPGVDPTERAMVSGERIHEALNKSWALRPGEKDHLEKVLDSRGHRLSEKTLDGMFDENFENNGNDFSSTQIVREHLPAAIPTPEVHETPQSGTEGSRVNPTIEEGATPSTEKTPDPYTEKNRNPEKYKDSESNWPYWALGIGLTGIAGYTVYESWKKSSRGYFEIMRKNPKAEGFKIVMPENETDAKKVTKKSGKLYRVINRHRGSLKDSKIYFETGDKPTSVDDEGNFHLNIYDKNLDAFLKQHLENSNQSLENEKADALEKSSYTEIKDEDRKQFKESVEKEPNFIRISGDPYYEKRLETKDLLAAGLEPHFELKFENAELKISKPYKLPEGRLAIMAYVKNDEGNYTARSYYRSNSSGMWRYLPSYVPNGRGGIEQYHKGSGEEILTAAAEMQHEISKITSDPKNIIDVSNAEFMFAGTCKNITSDLTVVREVKDKSKQIEGTFGVEDPYKEPGLYLHEDPERLGFKDKDFEPDFSKEFLQWQQENNTYGKYTIRVYPSKNDQLRYMYCEDERKRAWIGGIEVKSKIGSTGLREEWFDGGDMTVPAYEYYKGEIDQTGGRGSKTDRKGQYADMYEPYLKDVKVIKDYIEFRHGKLQEPKTGKRVVKQSYGSVKDSELAAAKPIGNKKADKEEKPKGRKIPPDESFEPVVRDVSETTELAKEPSSDTVTKQTSQAEPAEAIVEPDSIKLPESSVIDENSTEKKGSKDAASEIKVETTEDEIPTIFDDEAESAPAQSFEEADAELAKDKSPFSITGIGNRIKNMFGIKDSSGKSESANVENEEAIGSAEQEPKPVPKGLNEGNLADESAQSAEENIIDVDPDGEPIVEDKRNGEGNVETKENGESQIKNVFNLDPSEDYGLLKTRLIKIAKQRSLNSKKEYENWSQLMRPDKENAFQELVDEGMPLVTANEIIETIADKNALNFRGGTNVQPKLVEVYEKILRSFPNYEGSISKEEASNVSLVHLRQVIERISSLFGKNNLESLKEAINKSGKKYLTTDNKGIIKIKTNS